MFIKDDIIIARENFQRNFKIFKKWRIKLRFRTKKSNVSPLYELTGRPTVNLEKKSKYMVCYIYETKL